MDGRTGTVDWRRREPRGWWRRGRYGWLLVWDVAITMVAVLVGLLTGFWLVAEFLAGIWVLSLLMLGGLWTARRAAPPRRMRGTDV